MGSAPLPVDEPARLASLRRMGILDTPPEERFDRLTRLTASILGVPIALISLIDDDRQWFKSRIGLEDQETARDVAFCSHAVADADRAPRMVVPDAETDERFADNPLVTGDPNIRFYAGQVLRSPDGHAIGTLCAIDSRPRQLDAAGAQALEDLGALVEQEFARLRSAELLVRMERSERVKATILDTLAEGLILIDHDGAVLEWNPAAEVLLGLEADGLTGRHRGIGWTASRPDGTPWPMEDFPSELVRRTGEAIVDQLMVLDRPDGTTVTLRVSARPASTADGDDGVLVAFVDVTREHQLLADVARFQHLFDHANDIVTVIEPDGRVRYSSPSAERILGYHEGNRNPAGILGLVHPDDLPAAATELAGLADGTRDPKPFTVRVQAADGTWRHLECVGANLLDEPAIRGLVLTSRDTTERVELTAQLEYLAAHDPLTGLRNRSALGPSLDLALTRATATPGALPVVCFVDLDEFKAVNDTYGHAAGDDVIRTVGERIASVVRGEDTAVRVGGDEFVIVMQPVASAQAARAIAERVHAVLVEPPIRCGDHVVGASVGVALGRPDETASSLLARADEALYAAKAARPSKLVIAPDDRVSATA